MFSFFRMRFFDGMVKSVINDGSTIVDEFKAASNSVRAPLKMLSIENLF